MALRFTFAVLTGHSYIYHLLTCCLHCERYGAEWYTVIRNFGHESSHCSYLFLVHSILSHYLRTDGEGRKRGSVSTRSVSRYYLANQSYIQLVKLLPIPVSSYLLVLTSGGRWVLVSKMVKLKLLNVSKQRTVQCTIRSAAINNSYGVGAGILECVAPCSEVGAAASSAAAILSLHLVHFLCHLIQLVFQW